VKTLRTYDRRFDALSAITGLLGRGIATTLNPDTWQASDGRALGVRDAGPRGWAVVELTKAEGVQCRIEQLHQLAEEQFKFAATHESAAADAARRGDEKTVKSRMSQAAAHTKAAISFLEKMLSLVIETTGVTVADDAGRTAA
jgi:hypothetical protein